MAEESEPTTAPKTLYDELQAMFPGGKFPRFEGAIPFDELWVSELRTVNPSGKLTQDQGLDENEGLDQDQNNGYEGDVENCGHCREFSRTYAEPGADQQ